MKTWLCIAATLWGLSHAATLLAQDSVSPAERDKVVGQLNRLHGKRLVDGFKSSWSPDGSRIVCSRTPVGSGLRMVDAKTAAVTELVETGKDPAWSPKNPKLIAFVRNNEREEEVWLLELPEKKARKLIDGGYPTWSADGKTLFVHDRHNNRMIVVDIREGGRIRTTKTGLNVPWWYPAVSPDGKLVAYRGGRWLLVVDREEARTVRCFPLPAGQGLLAGWSSDGNLLGFGGWGSWDPGAFQLVDIRAGRFVQLPIPGLTLPSWSPDGSKVAIDVRFASKWEVWTLETKALRALTWTEMPRDRYTVPEAGVAELTQFLAELAAFRPDSPEAAIEHQHKQPEALQQAAQRILRLEKDKQSEAYRAASFIVLANRARAIGQVAPERQRQTMTALRHYLREHASTEAASAIAPVAMKAAESLESCGQRELAAEAFQSFADLLAKSPDTKLHEMAQSMKAAAKRLAPATK